MITLTKKSEVMKVIKAGGKICAGSRPGLVALMDKAGNNVPAWQTAIKAALKTLTGPRRSARPTARAVTNETGQACDDERGEA